MKLTTIATTLALTASAASAQSIASIASEDGRFATLLAAVEAAGLTETLAGPGAFTVFAPLDTAFEALPEGTVESLLQPENKQQLTDVLLYHVDDRVLTSSQLPEDSIYVKPILETARLCVTRDGGAVSIADSTPVAANVVVADIQADNGVIHVVDKVLLPGDRPACN
ncbi:MAG: fasciclin domain-containing protein [Pseudomonadota bacterium]